MFEKNSTSGYRQAMAGIDQKTLVYGEKSLMVEFRLQKGASLPRHSHPHEQIGYLVKGHLRLSIGDDLCDVQPGDSWCIPGDTPHCAECLADAVAVEVFAPRREDYLPEQE